MQAGQSFTAFGLIENRAGRRSSTGRATFSLRTSRTARSGRALGALTIKRVKGGAGRLFKIPMVISGSQAAGNYFLFVCVKQPGRTRAKCKSSALKVTTQPPAPAPAPAPADTRPRASDDVANDWEGRPRVAPPC